MTTTQFYHEIEASRLPAKLQDRLPRYFRRHAPLADTRLAYVSEPQCTPSYSWSPYEVRVACTPHDLINAKTVPLTLDEYFDLCVLLADVEIPLIEIRVAPAYFFPEVERELRADISFHDDIDAIAGAQCIPRKLFFKSIEELSLPLTTTQRLVSAGITTIGRILELDEAALRAVLTEEDLAILIAQLHVHHPTSLVFGRLAPSCAHPVRELAVYNEVYFAATDIIRDGKRQVLVSAFADRLTGRRTGAVYEAWLSEKQIAQSLPWTRELDRLDSYERRERVYRYVLAQGALPAPVQEMPEQEVAVSTESLSLVPVKDPLYLRLEDVEEQDKNNPQALLNTASGAAEKYQARLIARMEERVEIYASTSEQEDRRTLLAEQHIDHHQVRRLTALRGWIDNARELFQERTKATPLPGVALAPIVVQAYRPVFPSTGNRRMEQGRLRATTVGYRLSLALPFETVKDVLEATPPKHQRSLLTAFDLAAIQRSHLRQEQRKRALEQLRRLHTSERRSLVRVNFQTNEPSHLGHQVHRYRLLEDGSRVKVAGFPLINLTQKEASIA